MVELKQNNTFTKDAALVFTSSDSTTLAQADTTAVDHDIMDLGGDGFFNGRLVIDVTAIEVATGDEAYDISLQMSNSATFASGVVEKVTMRLGADATSHTGSADSTTGRYQIPVDNEYQGAGYRYLRIYTDGYGTLATGLTFTAFLSV